MRKARNLLSTSDQEYRICESGSSNIRQKRARFPLAETPKNGTRGQNAMDVSFVSLSLLSLLLPNGTHVSFIIDVSVISYCTIT